jgi:hypothetical protein
MSDPADCSWCRCALTSEEDGFGTGLCNGCLVDWLRHHPTEGVALHWKVPADQLDGKHDYAFLCPRCGGSGHVYASVRTPDTWCFSCGGDGWIAVNREGVQRTARWWSTYQTNRVPETRP